MAQGNSKNFTTPIFPFTAIVGQEEMKLALQLNVIDPKIGGVLIIGAEVTEQVEFGVFQKLGDKSTKKQGAV